MNAGIPGHPTERHPRQAGFTLLEVLVALMIVGIALGAVFQSFSQASRLGFKSGEVAEAARIARNVLADAALIETVLDEGDREGVVPEEPGWRYSLQVGPLQIRFDEDYEAVDVPSMVEFQLCLFHQTEQAVRKHCLSRWYRR
jgi:general secretion pathway protein I